MHYFQKFVKFFEWLQIQVKCERPLRELKKTCRKH